MERELGRSSVTPSAQLALVDKDAIGVILHAWSLAPLSPARHQHPQTPWDRSLSGAAPGRVRWAHIVRRRFVQCESSTEELGWKSHKDLI